MKSGNDVKLFIEQGQIRLVHEKKDVAVIPLQRLRRLATARMFIGALERRLASGYSRLESGRLWL
jgi:hypothetical protein